MTSKKWLLTAAFVVALTVGSVWGQGEDSDEEEAAFDLSSLGAKSEIFTPYLIEREPLWILLPVFGILVVLIHLKKFKAIPKPVESNFKARQQKGEKTK